MADQRIYQAVDGVTKRLIRAAHPSHVYMHLARKAFSVSIAKPEDIVEAMTGGVKVEDIKAEQGELEV